MDVDGFDVDSFKINLCTLFDPPCSTKAIGDLEIQPGSTLVNFTIDFVSGGPTVRNMREKLVDQVLVQEALGVDFPLVQPYRVPTMREITYHRSNYQLEFQFGGLKAFVILNLLFMLLGLWALVVFWSITVRGKGCRQRAHRKWAAELMPTAETLQVLVLSSFVQLILNLSLHLTFRETENFQKAFPLVIFFGVGVGAVGTLFNSLLNSWIRGESPSLRAALSVDQIDKLGTDWVDADANREYRQVYEAGGDRTLGKLATHDWEGYHKDMERALGLFDMSDQVFDEVKHEQDPSLLAAFLNSNLLGAFGGKKTADTEAEKLPVDLERQVVAVEVPAGLPRETLRDAMLQWRLRHTAHPQELEAVDWLLGQLDPTFGLIAVKVPDQARNLLVEALIQHAQNHAELQMDSCHAVRLQATLQQLSGRFHGQKVDLPDDGKGTEKIREVLVTALKARLEASSKRDITQEEGMLLQYTIAELGEGHSLVSMPQAKGAAAEDEAEALKAEIETRAEAIRDAHRDVYLYDHEIYTNVPLVTRTKPPDHIEIIETHGRGKAARKAKAASNLAKSVQIVPAPGAAPAASGPACGAVATAGAPTAAAPDAAPQATAPTPAPPAPEPPSAPPSPPAFAGKLPAPDGASSRNVTEGSKTMRSRRGFDRATSVGLDRGTSTGDLGQQEIKPPTVSQKLRLWWRFQRQRDAEDHSQMPCWKQYFTLFLGTCAIGACTISVVTLMSITPAHVDYYAAFSLSISIPLSIIFHQVARALIRALRRRMALQRGRSVEGAISGKALKKQAPRVGKDQSRMLAYVGGGRNDGDEGEGGDDFVDLAERSLTVGGARIGLRPVPERNVSAHLGGALLDASPSLEERTRARIGLRPVPERNVSAHLGGALLDASPSLEERTMTTAQGGAARLSSSQPESAPMRTQTRQATFKPGLERAKSRGSAIGRAEKMRLVEPEASQTQQALGNEVMRSATQAI